jgi:hypothetical protein
MGYRNQWLLQCERIHYYSVSARLQNDLFYDQRLAISCQPKHFAPRPALMPLKFSHSWYLCPVHALSFRHDIVGYTLSLGVAEFDGLTAGLETIQLCP